MDYIVNNTGIPSSEWWKYKPAGTSSTMDFSALAKTAEGGEGGLTKDDIVAKLSDGSKATLRRLKSNPNFISKREWMDLTSELNRMGVISDTDYMGSDALFHLVPLGDMDNPYTLTGDMRTALDKINQWPGNPFENYDMWAFSLKKWATVLSMERNPDGTPKYQSVDPIQKQASSCSLVSGLVKDLLKVV